MNYHTSRRTRRFVPALVVALIAFAGVEAAPAQESGSNLEVMRSLTRDVAVEVLTALEGARAGRALRLVSSENSEEYRFIEQEFTAVLVDRGVQVYRSAAETEADETRRAPLELQLRATEFSVSYPRIFRSYLIGGKKVRRDASVAVVATLVDPTDGAVLDVAEATRTEADQFAHGDLGEVEAGTFEFVRPPVPSSGWGRIVEPVFVSGIIVGLIYLFFSNQSDQ